MRGLRFLSNKKKRLAIYDDLFPYRASGFRLTEYTYLLKELPAAHVYTTLSSLNWLGIAAQRDEILQSWTEMEPSLTSRLHEIETADQLPHVDAVYTLFLNNALDLLPTVRARGIPFAFTLYPGGGMRFGDRMVDEQLREVLAEPLMRQVIVTQPSVLTYLQEGDFVLQDKITYVFGGVLRKSDVPRFDTEDNQEEIAVGFVAHRYHPDGLDKGLDLFLAAVDQLIDSGAPIKAHLFGPWDESDLGAVSHRANFFLHGLVGNDELGVQLARIQISIFPTREGVLADGAFDGFPTGAAVEAGLAGSTLLTTNPLHQQTPLVEGRDYFEIEPNVDSIVHRVRELIDDPTRMDEMRLKCRSSMASIYGEKAQLEPRASMLSELLSGRQSQ